MSHRSSTTQSVLRRVVVALFAFAAIWTHAARAQEASPEQGGGDAVAVGTGPLVTEIVVEKYEVEDAADDGTEERRFVRATRLDAGDEVHYTIRVRNPGKEPVLDVVVTKRLPFGLAYLPGSAVGPACDIELSSDGGATFAPAGRKGASYSHLRWLLRRPLAPGATALLRFRATFG